MTARASARLLRARGKDLRETCPQLSGLVASFGPHGRPPKRTAIGSVEHRRNSRVSVRQTVGPVRGEARGLYRRCGRLYPSAGLRRADLDTRELARHTERGESLRAHHRRGRGWTNREQHQPVRPDQSGHERGQPVVVAEPDLVRRDRVVLVDNREDPQLEQALRLPAARCRVCRIIDVVCGQEGPARR